MMAMSSCGSFRSRCVLLVHTVRLQYRQSLRVVCYKIVFCDDQMNENSRML